MLFFKQEGVVEIDTVEAKKIAKQRLGEYLALKGYISDPNKQQNISCFLGEHIDKHPSMTYYPNTQKCFCHTCRKVVDVFDAVKYIEQVDDREKFFKTYDVLGIQYEKKNEENKLNKTMRAAVNITKRNLNASSSFAKTQKKYLSDRKISQKEIDKFNIGIEFNNSIINELLKNNNYSDLHLLGLLKTGKDNIPYSTFNYRITFPICDENGNFVGFGGRTTNNKYSPKYLNSPQNKLFDKSKILYNYHNAKNFARNNEIILVEGYFDVVSASAMGMNNVVATMGLGLSEYQVDLLKKLNCKVILCLDNPVMDRAGLEGTKRMINLLVQNNIETTVYDVGTLSSDLKDFGDFNVNNISAEQIRTTEIPAIWFLLKYNYFNNKNIDISLIAKAFKDLQDKEIIKDTKDELFFQFYVSQNTLFSEKEIQQIIHPRESEKLVFSLEPDNASRVALKYFFSKALEAINTTIKTSESAEEKAILKKLVDNNYINESLFSELLNDNTIEIAEPSQIVNVIKTTDIYNEEKEKYSYEKAESRSDLPNIFDNVFVVDTDGKLKQVWLNEDQKDTVYTDYLYTFKDEAKRKEIMTKYNDDRLCKDMVIVNTWKDFVGLWKDDKTLYCNTLEKYIMTGQMVEMDYDIYAHHVSYDNPEALGKDVFKVDKNGEVLFKTKLIYSNVKNYLNLTEDNYIKSTERFKNDINNQKIIEKANKQPVIVTSDNYIKTTYGVYILLPNDDKKAVYIPWTDINNAEELKNDKTQKMQSYCIKSVSNKNSKLSLYTLTYPKDLTFNSRNFEKTINISQLKNLFDIQITKEVTKNGRS